MSTVAPSRPAESRGSREFFAPRVFHAGGGLGAAVASTLEAMRPPLLLERLTEQLGSSNELTALYAALLTKAIAAGDRSQIEVESILRDEREHAACVRAHLARFGVDPLVTPSPRHAETSRRIFQIIADPRTTVAQACSAVVGATLAAVGEWEAIVRAARAAPEESMAAEFARFRSATEEHVHRLRSRACQLSSA